MGNYLYHVGCPKCGSSDSLAIYKDGDGYCWSNCGYLSKKDVQGEKVRETRFSLEEVEGYPISPGFRGINAHTLEKYGVRRAFRPEDGTADTHVFYPSGLGQGYKRKNLRNKRDMSVIGEYKGLFGQDKFTQGGKFLVITEGEEDCLSVWQMFSEKGKDYSVVSLPNGSGLGGVDKDEVYNYITSFQGVLLVFDQDKEGWQAVERFAEIFGPSVKVKYAEFDAKDANQMLQEERYNEFYQAVWRSREYQPETVVPGSNVSFELVREPISQGHTFRQFPELSRSLGGSREGELTTILAPPGVGKSSLVAELGYDFITRSNYSVAWMFLEENLKKATQRLVALDNNVPLHLYRQNPDRLSEERIEASYNKLINNNQTFFIDLKHGMLDRDRLLPLLRWYHRCCGCKVFIFDHVSLVFSANESRDERQMIDSVLHELAAFATETQSHFILVAHIKRLLNKIYVSDKENDAQWLVIDPDSARGSGAFEQLSHNLIVLEPEYTEGGERGRTRINLKKNREVGVLGPTDVIKMSPYGRLISLSQEF